MLVLAEHCCLFLNIYFLSTVISINDDKRKIMLCGIIKSILKYLIISWFVINVNWELLKNGVTVFICVWIKVVFWRDLQEKCRTTSNAASKLLWMFSNSWKPVIPWLVSAPKQFIDHFFKFLKLDFITIKHVFALAVGLYSLSVRQHSGQMHAVLHYKIYQLHNGWFYIQQNHPFSTLSQLVDYYSREHKVAKSYPAIKSMF